MTSAPNSSNSQIFERIRLSCGRVVPNRLVKVAMYEHLTSFYGGPPNTDHLGLYAQWARGGWGMTFTGNVQVDRQHLTLGRDMVAPPDLSEGSLLPFKRLSDAMHGREQDGSRSLAVMQLSHGGRQSANFMGGRRLFHPPSAPSAIPVGRDGKTGWLNKILYRGLFTTPRAMDKADIDQVVDAFVRGARMAHLSGFDGVEIHASHGYLLASFISPKSNKRIDEYSCDTPGNALRVVQRVVASIRASCPADFVVGIKLNAADYVSGGANAEQRSIEHLRHIASWQTIDFVEISGGDYEDPDFMATSSSRQAFFSQYSVRAMQAFSEMQEIDVATPLVLLTGGLRAADTMRTVLSRGHAHLLGVGRSSVIHPDLPLLLRGDGGTSSTEDLVVAEPDMGDSIFTWVAMPKLVGANASVAWYVVQMRRLARGQAVDHSLGATGAIVRMWLDDHVLSFLSLLVTISFAGALAVLVALW